MRTLLSTCLVTGLAGGLLAATPLASHAALQDTANRGPRITDGRVYTVVHRGDTVYLGGDFTEIRDAAGTHRRRGAAAVDLSERRVLPWNPRVDGVVRDIAATRHGVYLGGNFTTVGGEPRRSLARVSTGRGTLQAFHPQISGVVKAVALSRKRLYVGGAFSAVGSHRRTDLAAFRRARPSRLTRWDPATGDGSVLDVLLRRRGVYVAGDFHSVNGDVTAQRIALVTRRTGALRAGFRSDVTGPVIDLARGGGRLFAALGGPSGGGLVAADRDTGMRLWSRRFDGDVNAVLKLGRQVYVGGHFASVCKGTQQATDNGDCLSGSTARNRGASLRVTDGAVGGWDPQANSNLGIRTLDAYPRARRLLAGGGFTEVAGDPRVQRFAIFTDGS